jgi:hypothetical protein
LKSRTLKNRTARQTRTPTTHQRNKRADQELKASSWRCQSWLNTKQRDAPLP